MRTILLALLASIATDASGANVRILDDRLELTEFVAAPEIRTPIGIAIDLRDQIYVVESHTHHPPKNYDGPKGDIIKRYRDADNDGCPEAVVNFAEGLQHAMNLAFSPAGVLHVVCAREVWALRDENGDGRVDGRDRILRVETDNTYAHSCQLGIAFDNDGWMYVSRGNNGGRAYQVLGADETRLQGFGDGGDVYRCRADGTELQRVATGFWNPFEVRFDSYGRLLALDNDPDARGPNRLVHVVPGGDYGYKSVYGGGGNHPFQGWDGSLPGILPYVAGVGEAPCGLFDCRLSSFPSDYSDHHLAAIWNENRISRIVPRAHGRSIKADVQPWIVGDEDFRPVAMAADSRGNLYITDWVKVAYPNHGAGRIWRVSTKANGDCLQPRAAFAPYLPLPGQMLTPGASPDVVREDLKSDDPFRRHAAVIQLAERFDPDVTRQLLGDRSAMVRRGALLAWRRQPIAETEVAGLLQPLLADPDESVRRLALMWIGEAGILLLKSELDRALQFPEVSADLFAAYIAAMELLDPAYIAGLAARRGSAKQVERGDATDAIVRILKDRSRSPRLRAQAVIQLGENPSAEISNLLRGLARDAAAVVQKEAIRSLAGSDRDETELFLALAEDAAQASIVRTEAIAALAGSPSTRHRLEILRTDAEVSVAQAVARALRPSDSSPERDRPTTAAEWARALAAGGDAIAGERVFFAERTQCAACHQVNHRGRRLGPDLSNVGQSLDRAQIVRAIVKPGDSFAPQYQAWFVDLKDDESYTGLQLDHRAGGDIELFTTEGRTRHFKGKDIIRYGVLEKSLMPEGLDAAMTVEEFRDLIAFLHQ